jgi:2-dehydro-3-deoxyphosphogluconate aldolase/(4S)-4-hydroxy-2-oxoglutarate aldolase
MDKSITPTESSKKARETCLVSKIIPVLSIQNIEDAIPLGEALIEGNLPVLEVTLRTPNALEIIKKMSTIKNAIVGVGTLINFQDVQGAVDVGARFGVSPGITNELLPHAKN